MRRMDWVIAISLIVLGLLCLAMSMSFIDHSEFIHVFMMRAVNYCVWIGIPLAIISLLFMWIKARKRRKG